MFISNKFGAIFGKFGVILTHISDYVFFTMCS